MGSANLPEVSSITLFTGRLGHLPEQSSAAEMSGMPFIPFPGTGCAFG